MGPNCQAFLHSITGMNMLINMNDINATIRSMESEMNQSTRHNDVPSDLRCAANSMGNNTHEASLFVTEATVKARIARNSPFRLRHPMCLLYHQQIQ